ncbi:Isorenieratene synthase OS=Streptomyces fumanus OX=67302 GN=crtU PE=4 SV=1 [Streptomyces fumanus]
MLAANALLARWGVRGETLWTVPDRGRSPLLRALARAGGAAHRRRRGA